MYKQSFEKQKSKINICINREKGRYLVAPPECKRWIFWRKRNVFCKNQFGFYGVDPIGYKKKMKKKTLSRCFCDMLDNAQKVDPMNPPD